jgi:hypothetical protein
MNRKELTNHQVAYMQEMEAWISVTFARYNNFETFKVAFNEYFLEYQHDQKQKMSLAEFKKGVISCSMAALVVGAWWHIISGIKPRFLIDREEAGFLKRSELHVLVALPLLNHLTTDNFGTATGQLLDENSYLIADYVYTENKDKQHKNGLRQTPTHRVPVLYEKVAGIENYLINRFQVFNYLLEHPSPPTESSSSPSTRSLPIDQPRK